MKQPTKEQRKRWERLRELGCIVGGCDNPAPYTTAKRAREGERTTIELSPYVTTITKATRAFIRWVAADGRKSMILSSVTWK